MSPVGVFMTWRRFAFPLALVLSLLCPAEARADANVVIRQVYGGGGTAGAPYANDFVELFNRSTTAVTLAGASIQYAPSGQMFTQSVALSGIIPAGGYYLIKLSGGTATATFLPIADAVGSMDLNATAGTVALVTTTALVSSCSSATLVDVVSYGPGSLCSEGGLPAAAPSDTTSVTRLSFGCQDTDNNQDDFQITPPRPLNALSSQHPCTSASCATELQGSSSSGPAAGGKGFVNVLTAEDCAWVASSNVSFITIISNASGKGAYPVVYEVAPNTAGAARPGTLTIAGKTFTVTQAGTDTPPSGGGFDSGGGGTPPTGGGGGSGGGTPPTGPFLAIDAPVPSAAVTSAFEVGGWAVDPAAPSGPGVDAVQFYLLPDGNLPSPVFLGTGSYGWNRADVGAQFGARFANSGYHFTITGMMPGTYLLGVYARSVVTGSFSISNTVRITVNANVLMSIDVPAPEVSISSPTLWVGGWAIDRTAPSGTGVDTAHVYAYRNPQDGNGEPAIFLGVATMGLTRGDVASLYGSRYADSGYQLVVDRASAGLTPGVYNIAVLTHSTATDTFNNWAVVRVILR
jgi:Lamin Tail Domain/Polysaccharide lyase family 4, domain II